MLRRAAYVVVIAIMAALAAAVVPWTVSPDALRSSVSARLRDLAGLELAAAGAGTVALLPVPRVSFESVALTAANGAAVVRGGRLRGELRILPLLAGRLEFGELSLADAAIDIDLGDDAGGAWDRGSAALRARLAAARGHLARLVLDDVDLRLRDRRTGFDTTVRGIDLTADWPAVNAPLELTGSMTWRGESVRIRAARIHPDALLAGRPSPFVLDLAAPLASLGLTGELGLNGSRRLGGRSAFATRSLRDFSAWSGVPLPLGDAIGPFGLDGEVRADGQEISWPAVRLTLGADRLEGALSWRADGERSTVTGTLAADRLDLTALAASLARLRAPEGGWSADVFTLPAASGMDLDLRLSAAAARIGSVRLDDLAANLTVKPGRTEASVNRVTVGKGIAKGRVLLTHAGDGLDVKGQSTFERLDVAALLAELGHARWAGDDAAEIVRSLHGRAHVTVRQGDVVGIALADLARRMEGRSDATPVAWRGGRTAFEQASLQASIAGGVAEITDAKLSGTGVRAALQGRTSLAHHTVAAKASVETAPAAPAAAAILDITGPWENPTIVPGARSASPRPEGGPPAVQ
jgi:AsmA protein